VRVGESGSHRREAIEVRGFNLRMPAQRRNPVVEVIDSDEKDVRLFLRWLSGDQCEREKKAGCEYTHTDSYRRAGMLSMGKGM
jgi:hypothetical protein